MRQIEEWNTSWSKRETLYRISPGRLARLNGYDMERIEEALTRYRNHGAGRWLTARQCHELWEETSLLTSRFKSEDYPAEQEGETDTITPDTMLIDTEESVPVKIQNPISDSIEQEIVNPISKDHFTLLLTIGSLIWLLLLQSKGGSTDPDEQL
jgi:hypothetical protein